MDHFGALFDLHFLGYKSDKLHHRCAEMLDQGAKTIDWDDFRFVLAVVRGGSVSAAAKQLGVDHDRDGSACALRAARLVAI